MIDSLAQELLLGHLLQRLQDEFSDFELLAHWTKGEYHHDIVVKLGDQKSLPGPVLVVSANCNGGIKELLCFDTAPSEEELWTLRDENLATDELPAVLAAAKTIHWVDPIGLVRRPTMADMRPSGAFDTTS